jgi:sugar phosphate isomerase/epimerase
MQRRTFLRAGALAGAGLALGAGRSWGQGQVVARDRIGMGTVLFRSRFKQTRPEDFRGGGSMLTLLDVPAYYRERFGVRVVEFWSYHFESLERGYLAELREKIRAAGSRLANIQVDTRYNLAAADEAERQESLVEVKRWIAAARFLGSETIRVNPGNGAVETSIRSMREVNEEAKRAGLPLLIENHFGIEMDPEVHLRIQREAGPENVYTLPDFGNYPPEVRYEALAKILPLAYHISAKVVEFNERWEHVTFDFDRCVRMAEAAGFQGVYLVEQWSRAHPEIDYEKVADWLIERVQANLRAGAGKGLRPAADVSRGM